ncbi:hypothetical protein BFG57_01200 [Bacillus solimangrovi]|uniref:Uncharacterized protein n=1 Tax=Bacillus solimangrovi TaxID=1305675 RepID=A0A1E5LHR7_9BACI|nr:hypothetical protein BFG57_01200 [Bacillus solimangrovi]
MQLIKKKYYSFRKITLISLVTICSMLLILFFIGFLYFAITSITTGENFLDDPEVREETHNLTGEL